MVQKPIAKSFLTEKDRWEALKKRPGVTILSTAKKEQGRLIVARKVSPEYQAAVATHWVWSRPTPEYPYTGSNKFYREFRRDSLVRNCIIANAFYPTAKGFETVLELADPGDLSEEQIAAQLEQYQNVKDEIDALNKAVNLDHVLFVAQIKRSIYGKAGFEIVLDKKGVPTQLLPLDSTQLEPELDGDWNLAGFEYDRQSGFYKPEQVLYFVNLSLEADQEGLSDIEPVLTMCETRQQILATDLKETAEKLWAPTVILTVDVSGLSDADAQKAIDQVITGIEPGKNIAMSQKVTATPVDLKSDIPGLIQSLEYLDFEIIGNFRVPKFLIGREKQVNRATAYAELEAYRDGKVADVQRHLRREIENQWYDRQVRRILDLVDPKKPLPVLVKHRWNPISVMDFAEMADAVSKLYDSGIGIIDRKKGYELLDFDPAELEEKGG